MKVVYRSLILMGSLGEGLFFVSGDEPDISRTVTLDATTTSLGSLANRSREHADPLNHCGNGSLVGPLSLLVQGLLAFLAFTSLIVKRCCEPKHERRTWIIWFYDTSKQAIGAAVIHFANLFLADVFTGDPCTWYFVSFLLDSTIGLIIIYIGLKLCQYIVIKKGWDSLRFGEYGKPPYCNMCRAWFGQCLLYILVMLVEKVLMTLLVQFHFWVDVREFLMSWVKSKNLEVVITVFIVPLVVNAFIFWVVDNFLKRKIRKSVLVDTNSDPEATMKFFKSSDRVKYYHKLAKTDDAHCLLANDDDSDGRYSHSESLQGEIRERLVDT
ncbi:store-operated calcium entry regulator STIMATE-like [Liolophura sinensis]|uniref:store-operated calcium entry regulator STIMATE-like n=1 Tax=Liolophura sinensis TaxID=3198878 RepID=UPI0031592FED